MLTEEEKKQRDTIRGDAERQAAKHPELKAGSIALFGVRKATMADAQHAGNGLTYVLEITDVVDRLHLAGALNANDPSKGLIGRRGAA